MYIRAFVCQKVILDLSGCPKFFLLLPPSRPLAVSSFLSPSQSDAKILVTQDKTTRKKWEGGISIST